MHNTSLALIEFYVEFSIATSHLAYFAMNSKYVEFRLILLYPRSIKTASRAGSRITAINYFALFLNFSDHWIYTKMVEICQI